MAFEKQLDESSLLELAAGLGRRWIEKAPSSLTILLSGDLGAGKTTFTRGFLNGCGHDGVVKSPTYTLVEPYDIAGHPIYHFDLYRLGDPEELEFTGARDCFGEEAACLIEWPEKADRMLPDPDLHCRLSVAGEERSIQVDVGSEIGKSLMLSAFPDLSL